MKVPTTLEILEAEWEKDSKIDQSEPGLELLKIPELHQKYLKALSQHNLIVKKLDIDYKKKRLILEEYYHGNLNNPEDLEEYGFKDPYNYTPGKKGKTQIMLDADDELNKILIRKIMNQEIVDKCVYILKELHSRTFQVRSFIDWYKFTNTSNGN